MSFEQFMCLMALLAVPLSLSICGYIERARDVAQSREANNATMDAIERELQQP